MVGTIAWPQTQWLVELRNELRRDIDHEVYVTLRVAVCSAAKMPRTDICRALGISDVEARMALQRITGVASRWANT